MKQFRLLLTLFALILGWTNVSAQSWQAYEVGEGVFYLYNVGTGQYFTKGNDYGTRASITTGSEIAALNAALKLTLESYNENYKLRTDVNASGYGVENLDGGNVYTDQSRNKNSTWTFTKVADASNGPVYTIISAENHGGGAGSYLTASADNTIVGPAAEVTDDYGRWQLLQSWITNNMPVSDANGWTVSQTPTFDSGNVCAEFWNKSGASIKQTVSNLPAGNYELIAVALTRDGMTATLNAGTNTMSIATVSNTVVNDRGAANTWFNANNGVNKLEFTHAGGNLEIGLTADNANGDHWLVWRSFYLLYKGVDLSELKAALQALIDAVPALEGSTSTAAYNAAKNYANGIDVDALTTEEDISTASTELANLLNAAKALQAPYSRYKTLKVAVEALDDDTSAFTGGATVSTDDADDAVEAATSLGDIEGAIALLRADAVTFLNAIVVNEGKSIDITDIWAVNPGFEEGNTNGWTNSGSIEANAQGNKVFDNTQGNYYAERWHAGGTVNLSQTITGLPAGSYVISAYLYTDTPDGVLFANESKTSFNTSNNYSVNVEVDDNGSINFGASCTLTTSTWICMDDFKIALAGVDHSRYNSVKEAVLAIAANDLDITHAEALNASAKKTEDIENAVKALRTALLTYLPNAEIPEVGYIDLTNAMVDNPTVSENVGYWTVTDVVRANQWGSGPTTNYGETEFYQSNFNIYQALTLCKGTYEFGVTGFHRAGNHATYFYAGEDKILIPGVPGKPSTGDDGQGGIEWVNSMEQAKTYFDNGNGKVSLKFALDNESNTLKIGIVNNDTETDRWTIFRNFTLKYFGSQVDLSSYVELLASTVTAANAVEGTVPSAVYQTLAAVVTENNKTYTTKEAYLTAIATIEEATATAKAMQDPYNRYKIVKAAVVAISETISTSEADAQAEAATTTEALDAAVVTLRTSLLSYLPTAVVAEGEFIDLTDAMVDNPTVRQNTSYWTIDGTPNGNYSWGKVSDEECEFYNQNFDFYQTLTLSKGTYEFGVTGFHRAGNHATYFYAGEDKVLIPGVESSVVNTMAAAKTYFDEGNGKVALKFALEGESNTLKIGIVNNDTETDKWTIFRDFTLKYYGSQVDLSSYEEAWNEAVAAAEAAIAANPNVTGEELTALNAAKVDTPQQTVESYQTKTNALTNATAAFQAAAPAYNDYAAEKEIVEIIGSPVADVPTTAEEALAAVQTMKLGASAYAEENYPADVTELVGDLSTWTGSEGTGTNNDQHWSGETKTYYEQGGANWAASSWDISYTKTVTLPAGKYMAKVAARGSDDIDYSKLTISATEHEMPLCLKGSVGTGITTSGAAQFADGEYANEGNGFGWEWNYLPFELTEETEVTFTLAAKNSLQYRWVSYCDFALLNTSATSDDYEALEAAKPENVVLGFDADDYAPYNNIVAATAMELANDIKPTESNAQVIVQQITAILNSATWTANTEEVNGVYDGTLANAPIQATDENVVMPGWVTKSGNMRQTFKGTGEDGKACLVDANDEVGLFVHPGTYAYGETFGYTLPLKAGVTYTAEAKYCSWAESSNQNFTLTILKDGEPVATKSFGANAASCTEAGALKHVELNFTPEENGNYVLNVVASGNTFMTDFVIMRAKAVKGDVNGDKKVDVADVTALVNILKSEVEKPATANVNGDDKIDAADVEALVNMILGIE